MSGVPEMSSSSSCSLNYINGSALNFPKTIHAYNSDKIFGNDFVKPSQQMLDLLFDRRVQAILRRKLNKLALILLSNSYRLASFFERYDSVHTKLRVMSDKEY